MPVNAPITHIVVHCSDSPHRGDTAVDVHRWHLENGWNGIGYNYTINETGLLESGRPEYWIGSHVGGQNTGKLGIMLFGESGRFTDVQYTVLRCLIGGLLERHPTALVCGHADLDPANRPYCPGFDVGRWWREEGGQRVP